MRLRRAQDGHKHMLSTVIASPATGKAAQPKGGRPVLRPRCCISDHSMNKMFFEQLGELAIPCFISRTYRREKFGGLRNRP
jgi:hypothetical protein